MLLGGLDRVGDKARSSLAVEDACASATYARLAGEVESLAHELQQAGVDSGDRVAVYATRSIGTINAVLAILRAGGCYVPISPSSPEQRQQMLLRDTLPKLMVTPNASGDAKQAFDCTVRRLDTGEITPYRGGTKREFRSAGDPGESAPAYVLYTSGSTGRPKGVVVSHRGALAFAKWAAQLVSLGPKDKVLNLTNFDFDLSIFDIFSTLLARARLYIAHDNVVRSPGLLVEAIREQKITVVYTVPWILTQMLDCGKDLSSHGSSLRAVLFAGEVFPIDQLKRLRRALPNARFYNLYGPTETNVCTFYPLPPTLPDEITEIPIGTPASGATISILDPAGRPLPDGEIGELHVEGPTVMVGYMNDGRMSPFGARYPTGDLGFRRADGNLMYCGRRDTMHKVRGLRIELLEVERVLGSHPQLRECAVCVIDRRLIAFVCAESRSIAALQLRQHVARFLPPYMVPNAVHFVSALPRNSNGKVDRQKLGAMLEGMGDCSTLSPSEVTTGA